MKEGSLYRDELFRVRNGAMLFDDRVYAEGELVSGAVVGPHLMTLIENGLLEPMEDSEASHAVPRQGGLLSRLLRARA
jgi:hypothetical protein